LKDMLQIYSITGGWHYLQIITDLFPDDFMKRLAALNVDCGDPSLVLSEQQVPKIDKYDSMVPDELLRKAFLNNELDVPEAVSVLKQIKMP